MPDTVEGYVKFGMLFGATVVTLSGMLLAAGKYLDSDAGRKHFGYLNNLMNKFGTYTSGKKQNPEPDFVDFEFKIEENPD